MKRNQAKELTFGDLIRAAYQVCGARKAARMVQLAFATHLVAFRKESRALDLLQKGKVWMNKANDPVIRIKMTQAVVLLTALMGCVG